MPALPPRTAWLRKGFTLVELIAVIAITSIIAVMAMTRFVGPSQFAVQGTADQLAATLRQAQTLARAQRVTVYVVLTAQPAKAQVCLDAACAQPLEGPAGVANWLRDADTVKLSAATGLNFDSQGRPSNGSTLQWQAQSLDGSISSQFVRLEPVTGHITVTTL